MSFFTLRHTSKKKKKNLIVRYKIVHIWRMGEGRGLGSYLVKNDPAEGYSRTGNECRNSLVQSILDDLF